MPTGSRIRTDNVFGTVTDNPLTAGALTLNSAGLVNLAAVTANHAVIVLDPLRAAGAPEVVIVTAHTAAASSATITRGAYGTTARSHNAGVLWVHAPTTEDTIRIVTSGTRPTDPYRGQLVFETDTNSYVGRDTSDAWQTAVQMGAWTAYTPSNINITVGNGVQAAAYVRVGRFIAVRYSLVWGTTTTFATGVTIGMPVAGAAGFGGGGSFYELDTGTNHYGGIVIPGYGTAGATATSAMCVYPSGGTIGTAHPGGAAWASTDRLVAGFFYEAAS